MFLNVEDSYNLYVGAHNERSALIPRNPRRRWWQSKLFKVFSLSLTLTGFLLSFTSAMYFMVFSRNEFLYFLIAAILCLAVFVHLITVSDGLSFSAPRPVTAVAVRLTSNENLDSLFRRTQGMDQGGLGERMPSSVPVRSHSTLSLPAYILVPQELHEREESSNASTESTLSAEEVTRVDEDMANFPTPAAPRNSVAGEPLPTTELSEAAEVISQIVKDSLGEKEGGEQAAEKSSDSSKDSQDVEGVRQRKPSPMETQQHVLLPEG